MEISSRFSKLNFMQKRWTAILKSNLTNCPHDIAFAVGQATTREIITCHKFVLSVASPVFEDLIRKNGAEEEPIVLPDVDIPAFKKLLKHIYQDAYEEKLSFEEALSVIILAKRFKIPEIEEHYSGRIKSVLSKTTAVTIFQESYRANESFLQRKACRFILSRFEDIMESKDFLQFDLSHLYTFLVSDKLCVYSEIDLFKALKRWGENQCDLRGMEKSPENLRQVLNRVIYGIRIPTMTMEEFVSIVEPSNLLDADSIKSLTSFFANRQTNRNYDDNTLKFSTKMRNCKKGDLTAQFYYFGLFSDYESITDDLQEYNSERFRVTGDCSFIYLKEVRFGNLVGPVGDLVIIMKIEKDAPEELLAVTQKSFNNDNDISAEFNSPVHMKMDTTYRISYKCIKGGLRRLPAEKMKDERKQIIFKHPYIPAKSASVEILDTSRLPQSHKKQKVETRNASKKRYIHSLKFILN